MRIYTFEDTADVYPCSFGNTSEWCYILSQSWVDSPWISENRTAVRGNELRLYEIDGRKEHFVWKKHRHCQVEPPIYLREEHCFAFLVTDIEKEEIRLYSYRVADKTLEILHRLSFEEFPPNPNFVIQGPNLHWFSADGETNRLQMIYPTMQQFLLEMNENVSHISSDVLYTNEWREEEVQGEYVYYEYLRVRDLRSGKCLKKERATLAAMPDGSYWKMKTSEQS